MSLASTVKTSVTTAPTAQTAVAALVGGLYTTALDLLQAYVKGFHAPSAGTVALIVAWLTVVASHVTASASSATPLPALAVPEADRPGELAVTPPTAAPPPAAPPAAPSSPTAPLS